MATLLHSGVHNAYVGFRCLQDEQGWLIVVGLRFDLCTCTGAGTKGLPTKKTTYKKTSDELAPDTMTPDILTLDKMAPDISVLQKNTQMGSFQSQAFYFSGDLVLEKSDWAY